MAVRQLPHAGEASVEPPRRPPHTLPVRRLAASALLVAAILAVPPRARAGDPAWRWFTIETPHFRVHFYRSPRHDLAPLARRAARLAERAHAALAPAMGHAPRARPTSSSPTTATAPTARRR